MAQNNMFKKEKSPDVSIDEALEMFLALTYPQGVPDDVDKEKLFALLRSKISQDRPDWAEKSEAAKPAPKTVTEGENYSKIKQAIIDQSNQPEIPQDPEERYLYERKQEALANLERKKEEEQEAADQAALRQKLIEQNKEHQDKELLNKAQQVKLELQKRLNLSGALSAPGFSDEGGSSALDELNTAPLQLDDDQLDVDFDNDSGELSGAPKNRELEMYKSIAKLDRDDRIKAMRAFNDSRRKMIGDKKSVLKPRDSFNTKGDERFSMDVNLSLDLNDDPGRRFLDYLQEKRSRKSFFSNDLKRGKAAHELVTSMNIDENSFSNQRTGSSMPETNDPMERAAAKGASDLMSLSNQRRDESFAGAYSKTDYTDAMRNSFGENNTKKRKGLLLED